MEIHDTQHSIIIWFVPAVKLLVRKMVFANLTSLAMPYHSCKPLLSLITFQSSHWTNGNQWFELISANMTRIFLYDCYCPTCNVIHNLENSNTLIFYFSAQAHAFLSLRLLIKLLALLIKLLAVHYVCSPNSKTHP